MKIQTLSIAFNSPKCINSCPFCISRMRKKEEYIENNNLKNFEKCLKYVKDLGVNTVILTGETEPILNKYFFKKLKIIKKYFYNIELQTSGIFLNKYLTKLKKYGITTISISLASLEENINNKIINNNRIPIKFDLFEKIKKDFILRLSLNLNTKGYMDLQLGKIMFINYIFIKLNTIKPHQVTFRKLYYTGNNKYTQWIKQYTDDNMIKVLNAYIKENGKFLHTLPYGFEKYSLNDMSIVIDDDCMGKNNKKDLKYLILRPDNHLYTQWDDKGSILL